MSNSVIPRAREAADNPATELRVANRTLSAIGVEPDLGFSSVRSPTARFGAPSTEVGLPSRPFSPTAPEFIPGAVYASREGFNRIMNQVNITRPSHDEDQGGVSLVPRRTPVVPNSGLKLRSLPLSNEHGGEILMDAQDRAWQAFHRTDLAAYDFKASSQNQIASSDNLNHSYPCYSAAKVSNVSCNARLLVESPPHMTADSQPSGYEQYARLNSSHSDSQNKQNSAIPGSFDERWVQNPEKMWNTNTTRTSPLTISPGESATDSEGEYVSSGSISGQSSFVNATMHPSSIIAHANPSESLESWLDAVGPNAEGGISLSSRYTPAHTFSEECDTKGVKVSMAHNEQHQAEKYPENFAQDISIDVLCQNNEASEHLRTYTSYTGKDNSYEGNSEAKALTSQHASEEALAGLKWESLDSSVRVPVPRSSSPQRSINSFSTSDRQLEIAKGMAKDAALALEESGHHDQLFDLVETGSGSRDDTAWMSPLIEQAKQRRVLSQVRKMEEIGVNGKHHAGFYASITGQDLPSVVLTPNTNSPQISTGVTAHDISTFETSSAGHTMRRSLKAYNKNHFQPEPRPEMNKTNEHTGAFSSHLSATMSMTNIREQEERVKTLGILQTQLSTDITIQDTYGQQQRSHSLRAASGEKLYYEMKDLHDRPYILPWPPVEGSPAYKARHKPEQLLYLEAHPKGFFVSHPIDCTDEIVRAHYRWLSSGLGNINSLEISTQTQSQFGNSRSGNQVHSAPQVENCDRFTSTQNELQQLDSVLHRFQQFVTSQSKNHSPVNTQNVQQENEHPQTMEFGDESLCTNNAINYEQHAVRSFVPSITGPLVIIEDGVPSTQIPDLSPMISASASQTARCTSVSAPALAGPSALAVPNSSGPGYSDSTLGSYRSNHRPAMLCYRPGVDTMFPIPMERPSSRYRRLTCCGQPNYETATNDEFQPFYEAARFRKPALWGVMKFTGIPYAVSKQDILAFLGRNAKILTPNYGEPIHIIMERATGKTMDAYVEFFSHADAQAAVSKFMRGRMEQDRSFRMMDRHVKVELSSQDALMRDLFPKAKNVRWNGQIPVIIPPDDPFNSGFKSFLSGEELHTLTKLVDSSNGFPWFAIHLYTLFQRDQLFNATLKMLRSLMASVSPTSPFGLTSELLTDLLYAGLNAPGFSEKQKWDLCQVADWAAKAVAISPLTRGWPWLVLARKPDWDDDVIMFYAQILNAYNQKGISPNAPNESFFGDMLTSGLHVSVNVSLEAAARTEWQHFKHLVKLVLSHQFEEDGGIRNKRSTTKGDAATNDFSKTRIRAEKDKDSRTNDVLVMHNGPLASFCAGQDHIAATDSHEKANCAQGSINRQAPTNPAIACNVPVTGGFAATSNFHKTNQFSGTENFLTTSNNLPSVGQNLARNAFPQASFSTATGKLPTITEATATGIHATMSHCPTPNLPVGTGSTPASMKVPVPNNDSGPSNSSSPSYLPGTSKHQSRASFFMPSKSPTASTFSGTGIFAMTSNLPGTHSRVSSISAADLGTLPAIGTAAPRRIDSDVEGAGVPRQRRQ
ncbi:hypothetical protein MMC26_007433 [Xylographa opegraphella]|nr:hypothetical protein [Xylographa opegraphella]